MSKKQCPANNCFNIVRHIPETDEYRLNVKELDDLRTSWSEFSTLTSKTEISKEKLFNNCISFFNWYIDYATAIIKREPYCEKFLCDNLFRATHKSKKPHNAYLLSSLQISKEYVAHLQSEISKTNVHRYEHTMAYLGIDLECLIANVEVSLKKTVTRIVLSGWRRNVLSPRDIYSSAYALFSIEKCDDVENLYLSDLKPNVMFQIRQLLEVYGKKLLGYSSIVDAKGNPIKQFTQIAWTLIKDEVKKTNSRIKLPFDINIMISINNWTNRFVHTTHISNSYLQYFALNCISHLFKPSNSRIKTYKGKYCISHEYAAIEITEYLSLRSDIEATLKQKVPNLSVEWLDYDKVGAYIVSL